MKTVPIDDHNPGIFFINQGTFFQFFKKVRGDLLLSLSSYEPGMTAPAGQKRKAHFYQETRKQLKGAPYYPRKICKSEYRIRIQYLILPGCLEFCLQIIIQNASISHARRQTFNRAPNFVKVPRLCTIQSASNSQAKIRLRTRFLQNSFKWLL